MVKNPPANAGDFRRFGFDPRGGKTPLEKVKATRSSVLPGEFRGQRSLVGYSPWGSQRESHITETTWHAGMQTLRIHCQDWESAKVCVDSSASQLKGKDSSPDLLHSFFFPTVLAFPILLCL